jgi:hypothetical protein
VTGPTPVPVPWKKFQKKDKKTREMIVTLIGSGQINKLGNVTYLTKYNLVTRGKSSMA